jgi:hypothetical protein
MSLIELSISLAPSLTAASGSKEIGVVVADHKSPSLIFLPQPKRLWSTHEAHRGRCALLTLPTALAWPCFAHLIGAKRRPALAQAVMAPLICWSFQQLDVQVAFGRPGGASNVMWRGRGQIERRLSVRGCTDGCAA